MQSASEILRVLDRAAENYALPMLDNGYVYLAATRMSLFRSIDDWAVVVEVFGYSPRAGLPDVSVFTIGSRLWERDRPDSYATLEAYRNYLEQHPNDDVRSFYPLEEGPWLDRQSCDWVSDGAH